MVSARQRDASVAGAWLCAGAALALLVLMPGPAAADVIFRVPEVLVSHVLLLANGGTKVFRGI